MRLIGSRIYLRAFELDDYLIINTWRQNSELTKMLSSNSFLVSQEREKKWVAEKILNDKANIYLAICNKEDNTMVGYCSINNIDLRNQKAEWGGTIIGDTKFWGIGYAKESAILMLNHLFLEYPIHKCYAYCLEEHEVTQKLFASLGFMKDGVFRDDLFKNGKFKTRLGYSVLKDDYIKLFL
jgi:ribosomal-protein-alanine N-acetyltransferase